MLLYHDCPPVRKIHIILSLKLVDRLHIQADKPWYNYNLKCLFLTFNILLESKINISLCTDLIFTDLLS